MTKMESIIGDIYDAWRAQDLDRLASYLPDDFSHMIYIPNEVPITADNARGKIIVREVPPGSIADWYSPTEGRSSCCSPSTSRT